ncbi:MULTISPECIES: translational GTPase TypA [Pseudoalteromonas]|jgi:GTP-binding protein|uniref:Large ribosomal subunit assembly factor BipA n=1 Tax=Pseudoalteromonas lipolytica TaxID=570156 RepID=A0AAD0S0H8_9GAMM|nr:MULTISPECIES: translational GTPase TypA [Pseudoalteromonas]AXV64001.1 translational GTPase TypA [Pseudoalteromonas donghaensis]EWH04224.1 GTP-binding protein TypA [Pseudoalteromonas lipolytica SCSIO 04301]MBE0352333.1 GTP-binding protein [Pseudoalteromonas lipolytica LMEB 39]MCC9660647.1 translational GTPase TypA [Pseudoalteromonas sp. MB41]QLJ08486.1 translational GTPase TypA [Pseudoalteromonas sp. JSTW]|tara:strand:- start:7 stop:1830 length:1824 start_codon:yes stop_codon:yes gene_type:complete
MSIEKLRNIAIIAHVDHGKTTLVDKLLEQSGTLETRGGNEERVMDSNDIEKERGITILAKNTAISWNDYHINIVDTPGHADFGGEVERVLSMADSVLLLVDAQEGPMPQTRFVTQKAFAQGLKPIVVINKIDKPGARPDWVMDQIFDLFDNLGATDEQLDFKVIYASAINGWATLDLDEPSDNMEPMFKMIVDEVSPPDADPEGDFQMQISQLDYNSYVGVIGIGRIKRGSVAPNQQVTIISADGTKRNGKIGAVQSYLGLERIDTDRGYAGNIVTVTGIGELKISDTVCAPSNVEALPPLSVDEPTVTMTFSVNTSPFAGKEGKFVTSRNILERLQAELVHNVALRVEETDNPDSFRVSGRGELHLGILIENMRREGYELAVSRPEVILRTVDGVLEEPYETVTIDCQEEHQGSIMEQIGLRKGELTDMAPDGKGRMRMDFMMPSRGLIGFQTDFMTLTSGSGLMYHTFDHYGPHKGGNIGLRKNGVMIANATGKALTNALFNLQERGKLFIGHGVEVYEGMVIGIHSRDNDLTVNALKGKQLTNVRASGTDEAQTLTPPLNYTLEQALEFIDDDELVEVTPENIRIRKRHLTESDRKRASRASKG